MTSRSVNRALDHEPGFGRRFGKAVVKSSVALLLAVMFGLAAPASAQTETGDGAAASGEVVRVDASLASARATMRTFLEALADSDLDRAAKTLDLSETGLSERLHGLRGPEIAVQLKAAVDRVRLVEYDDLPDAAEGPPYVFWRGNEGLIEIVRASDGAWRFSPRTIELLPETERELSDRKTVEGVEEIPQSRSQWLRAHIPVPLTGPGFILEHWQWLALFAVVMVGVAIDLAARLVLFVVVSRRMRRIVNLEPAKIRRSLRPFGLVAMAAFWWFCLGWLGLPDRPLTVLATAVEIVAVAAAVWLLYRVIELFAAVLDQRAQESESKLDDMLVPLFERSTKIFVLVFGLIFLADSLRIPITSLLAGIGIGGLALALAAQDLVKNLFGSVTVLLDRPFEIGDYIEVSGIEGSVEEVAFRSTRIRTPSDTLVTLPNANLISAAVENYGRRRFRRWRTQIGLAYGTPTAKVTEFCEGLRALVAERDDTRKEGFYAELNDLGASSLDVLFQVFFAVPGYAEELRGKHEITVAILELAEELGIEIAFPTQTIHIEAQQGLALGMEQKPASKPTR